MRELGFSSRFWGLEKGCSMDLSRWWGGEIYLTGERRREGERDREKVLCSNVVWLVFIPPR